MIIDYKNKSNRHYRFSTDENGKEQGLSRYLDSDGKE